MKLQKAILAEIRLQFEATENEYGKLAVVEHVPK